MKRIYLSGQITDLNPYRCKLNFAQAEDKMHEWAKQNYTHAIKIGVMTSYFTDKYEIINPLNIKPLFGIKKWFFFMWNDLKILKKCDVIAVQENWTKSKGAVIEYFLAKFIWKIKVVEVPA